MKPVSATLRDGGARIDGAAFDYGPCLAAGQTIRHEFPLVNLTDRDIPILGAMAFTPCCSTIGPTPRVVPAGKTVMIPVTLHVGSSTGRKRVEFALATGDKARKQHGMSLTIDLLGESEVLRDGDANPSIPINRPQRWNLVLVSRGDGTSGLGPVTSIKARAPLVATIAGKPVRTDLGSGLVEYRQAAVIDIPPCRSVGPQSSEIELVRDGGRELPHVLSWRVTGQVDATPSGFSLARSSGPVVKSILVRAKDRPFRIMSVKGDLVIPSPLPNDVADSHRIDLHLDTARLTANRASDVRIMLDHPDQPVITISILLLPAK